MKIKFSLIYCTFFMAMLICLTKVESVEAGVVEASGFDDSYNIQQELYENRSVTLKKGSTYRLYETIILSSNMIIEAEGATIICEKPIAFNIPRETNYNALTNVTIIGGTWKSESEGYYGSSFKFTHASNIKLKNMKIRSANLSGHSLEFVACKNVTIDHCDIAGLGHSSSMTEEAVQLDLASSVTAPYLNGEPFNTDLAYELWNNAGCKNITIKNCKIKGNRGVVANYTSSDGDAVETTHTNIVLKNNVITGLNGEGVALFNTKNATVINNKIKSLREGKDDAYTVGLHLDTFSSDSDIENAVIKISKNTVYGGRQSVMVYSHSGVKFGKVTIEKNKLFCKAGKTAAIHAKEQSISRIVIKTNTIKTYKDK